MRNNNYRSLAVAAIVSVLSVAAIADDAKTPEAKPKAAISAQFGTDAPIEGHRQLLVYSEGELTQVQYKFDGVEGWDAMTVGKPPEGFGYYTTSHLPTKKDQKYLVRGVRKDGTRFTNSLTVQMADRDPVVIVAPFLEETKEAVAAEAKKGIVAAPGAVAAPAAAAVGLSATEQEMITAANAYRARHGKGPLQVSPELMNAARSFVVSGRYDHGTAGAIAARSGFGGRTTENIAGGRMTGAGVVQFWGEPGVGHEKQLAGQINVNKRWVDGGFTHVGVAGANGNWVIYFGSK